MDTKEASKAQKCRAAVTRLASEEREELLRFRGKVHGAESIFSDPDYFQWMYYAAPPAEAQGACCWVHRTAASIDGQLGGYRARLRIEGEEESALWVLDGAVDEQQRGRGIFSSMLESAVGATRVAMATETSPGGRRAMLRLGWRDLGTLPLFVRLLDARAWLSAGGHRTAGRTLGAAVDAAMNAFDRAALLACSRAGLALQYVQRFDRRSDQIWQEQSRFYPVICRRDLTHLDWRFSRYPEARYSVFYLLHQGEAVGYAVLRFGARGSLPAGYLVDFLCPPNTLFGLLTLCIDLCRKRAQSMLCCLHSNPVSSHPFLLHGFRPRDTGWPFLVHASELHPDRRAIVFDRRKWFLTAADSDLDRPRPEEGLRTRAPA